ncbi:MAG: amidohydrolase family protein [Anaerolineae bacterium]|jgi:predicted TIM-barrel fold metal-dependent hydrolase
MRIDAHAHVWIADGRRQATSLDRLLDACDRLEIDEAWVSCPVTHGMGSPEEVRERNDAVLDAMRRHPTRFRGYCFVVAGYYREALAEIDRCLDQGMIGIKLYHQYFINDPAVFPVVEKAIEERIPILCHAGHPAGEKGRRLEPKISDGVHFADLARRYPEATLIMAHIGGGGDYEWSLQAIADYPNIYADTSGSVIDEGMVEYAAALLGPERLIFGCDETEEGGVGKLLGADLPEEVRQMIFSGTALRILGQRRRA